MCDSCRDGDDGDVKFATVIGMEMMGDVKCATVIGMETMGSSNVQQL